jgi:hypothetical protein
LGKDGGRLYSMGYIGPRPFSIASLKVANKNTFPGARRCLRLLVLYQIDLISIFFASCWGEALFFQVRVRSPSERVASSGSPSIFSGSGRTRSNELLRISL